jgi:two-component SAPR family response regulator
LPQFWESDGMDDHDMVLALAICDLLEKSVTPKDVEKAFERAKKRLELSRQPPREAKISYARRRE